MSLMYAAIRTRPDVLKETTYLATKSAVPYEGDWDNLVQILCYLKANPSKKVYFRHSDSKEIEFFDDASFRIHTDTGSHTRIIGKLFKRAQAIFALIFKFALNSYILKNVKFRSDFCRMESYPARVHGNIKSYDGSWAYDEVRFVDLTFLMNWTQFFSKAMDKRYTFFIRNNIFMFY
jgi:hypothetical protein